MSRMSVGLKEPPLELASNLDRAGYAATAITFDGPSRGEKLSQNFAGAHLQKASHLCSLPHFHDFTTLPAMDVRVQHRIQQ